ncbi:uncharacterized protein LOC128955169 [Oppia nitens]|uniref:uncharacterized protein LOC128955169 n=1 Tax=Oppia nitens TaxID=1686743 RepID=UPI0023DA650C|nr:uncharacterized protein LOC128955169 [Oppia nitens]
MCYPNRLLGVLYSSSCCCIAYAGMTILEAYNWRNNRHQLHRQQQQYHRQRQQPIRQWFHRSSISSGLPSDSWLRYATAADDDDTDDGSYDDDDDDNDIDIDWIIDVCKKSLVICNQIEFDGDIDSFGNHGSGFRVRLFGDNLLIVTNAHVVQGCHTVLLVVNYANHIVQLYGTVEYVEQQLDLALIRLRMDDTGFSDNFQPRPLADYTSSGPPIPSPGDPIVAVAHSQVPNNKHPGIVRALGCPPLTDMDDWYTISVNVYNWTDQLMLSHTARIVSGFSGGPLVDAAANIVGVNDLGCEFDLFYNITSTDTIDFIRRGKQYMTNEFPIKYAKREDSYTTKSSLKLGIIVGCRRLLNNRFIIDDILPETNCSKLYIDCEIVDINGQQLTNIRQFTDTLIGLKDNEKIQLNLIENIFAVKMQPLIQVCKYSINSPIGLPIVF